MFDEYALISINLNTLCYICIQNDGNTQVILISELYDTLFKKKVYRTPDGFL